MTTIKDTKSYRILIVEDNLGDFVLISELLADEIEQPKLTHATTFKEAKYLLQKNDCDYDVILLDLSLPDISKTKLIEEILVIANTFPIIVLTGYEDIEFSKISISQGILDYIFKNEINAHLLHKSVIYAIERKKTISALKKSEKQYADLFNLSPQPMWVYDTQTYRFVQVNNAAVMHYGYTEAEFLSMTIWDIRPKSEINKVFNQLNLGIDENIKKGKFLHLTKTAAVIEVEIYSTPINQQNYRSVLAIDITESVLYEHKITKAIIKTQEDERYEIGAELHDNVCQILAVSQISLGMLKNTLDENKIPIYNLCKENIALALHEIRNISHQLAPVFFEDTTLEFAFNRLLNNFNTNEKYEIFLKIEPVILNANLGRDLQLNLYRILQEQLSNISKHSFAKNINIIVSIKNNHLYMQIEDDGVGIDLKKQTGGIGFANIKRRVELFSGSMVLTTSPENGFILKAKIPLQNQA